MICVALGFVKREPGKVNGLHSTSVNPTCWSSHATLLDLDAAKEQFLHFYPLLTLDIEPPFVRNVKIIMGMLHAESIFNAICYHPTSDLLVWRLGERGDWYET